MRKFFLFLLLVFATPCLAANHAFTGLPLDADGWTDFDTLTGTGYSTARVVFVSSSSGNDTNAESNIASNGHYGVADLTFDASGIFQAPAGVVPFATIATAYAYCRDGSPDIILLERGSSWSAGIGSYYINSGSSQTTPHIIASYGASGNRPKLVDTIDLKGSAKSYVIVSGIHLQATDWTTADRAIDIRSGAAYITFEDVYIEGHAGDIVTGTTTTNISFRRCYWLHGEARDGQFYMVDAKNVLFEECVFYEPYNETYPDESRTGRHLYFAHSEATYHVRGCIFYNGWRAAAVDLRRGSNFYANLVSYSSFAQGDVGSGDREETGGNIYNNVFEFAPPDASSDSTNKITIISNILGTQVYENIVHNTGSATANVDGITIATNYGAEDPMPVAKNISIHDNILYGIAPATGKSNGIRFSSAITDAENINIYDNDIQMINGTESGYIINMSSFFYGKVTFSGNRYFSTESAANWFAQGNAAAWEAATGDSGYTTTQITYTDPARTSAGYYQSIGGSASTPSFMAAAIAQSRSNWNANRSALSVINYVRAGYDKDPVYYTYDESPTSAVPAIRSIGSGAAGSVGSGAGFTLK